MKKIIVIVVALLLADFAIMAQRRNGFIGHRSEEAGMLTFSLGVAQCQDDPYGSQFDKLFYQGHNFKVGMGYLQSLGSNNHFAYRALLQYVNLSGQDLPDQMHSKGFYSYNANVFQFSGRAEYQYSFGKRFRIRKPNTFYGFLGAGTLLSFCSYPSVEGQVVYEGKSTPSLGFFVPIGGGYRYDLDRNFSVGVEICEQIVFTDLVDGYKGSHIAGKSKINDNITSFSLTLAYKLF